MAPQVSVIIPCYNHGQYLDEAVNSVLSQTCQDFEIVVVDDGSTDPATTALLADYRRPKTRVLRLPHGGLAAARNAGIANTTGDYICALDADDLLEPPFLQKTLQSFDSDPSLTFVSTWLQAFGAEEFEWKPERCDLPTLLWEDTVLTAALVRRAAVLAVGGYDAGMPVQGDEDWDLWLTLVERGYRGVILPEMLFKYRRRAGSMSTVSWYGHGHLPLTNYRVVKHSDTYGDHLLDVLLHQDGDATALLRQNDQLERDIATELEPAVALRRQELALLRSRLSSLESREARTPTAGSDDHSHDSAQRLTEEIHHLESALSAASAEVRALRTSMSWRVTSPLRDVYGWWLRRWKAP